MSRKLLDYCFVCGKEIYTDDKYEEDERGTRHKDCRVVCGGCVLCDKEVYEGDMVYATTDDPYGDNLMCHKDCVEKMLKTEPLKVLTAFDIILKTAKDEDIW